VKIFAMVKLPIRPAKKLLPVTSMLDIFLPSFQPLSSVVENRPADAKFPAAHNNEHK